MTYKIHDIHSEIEDSYETSVDPVYFNNLITETISALTCVTMSLIDVGSYLDKHDESYLNRTDLNRLRNFKDYLLKFDKRLTGYYKKKWSDFESE